MVYLFARIGDALGRTDEDVYAQNRWLRVRLCERGAKLRIPGEVARESAVMSPSMRVPVECDHGFRWKMITQSGGT
jgi:hypothetical protein